MAHKQAFNVTGMFRVKLGETGPDGKVQIIGDSGWKKNEVTNLGFQHYMVELIGGIAGSRQVSAVVIGTGGAPAAGDTSLAGSTKAQTCGNAVVSSKTLRCTAAIASGAHPGGTPDIANIALHYQTAAGGTILCGNTFSSSTWNSNQGLSCTYELRFQTG